MGGSTHGAIPASNGAFPGHATGPTWEPGSVIGDRFVLRAHLGEGRYGHVYKALDRAWSDGQLRLEQHVALHVLDERVRAQTQLLRKLETSYLQPHLWSHPNIVKIRGFGSDRGAYFLSMELLEGRSLREVVDEIRPNLLSPDTALAILQNVGDALTYAHDKHVVHGDIRAETVFLTNDQTVKVLDLLPASTARSVPFFVEDTAPDGLVSPDPRDDVYGLACLAYELLAGRHPYNGATALEALGSGVAPASVTGLAPERWDALARGLALRRAERTASITELMIGLCVREPERAGAGPRTSAPAAESCDERRAAADDDDDEITLFGDLNTPRRAEAENARDDEPVTGASLSPRRGARTDRTDPDLGFRAKQLREPWQPSEPVVPMQDVHAYWGHARRRRERRRSRAVVPLLSFGILAALGTTAYLTYAPFGDTVRQLVAAAEDTLGAVAREEAPATAARERADTAAPSPAAERMSTGTVAPEPIVSVTSPVASTPAEPADPDGSRAAPRTAATAEPPDAAAAVAADRTAATSAAAAAPGAKDAADAPSMPTSAAATADAARVIEPERFELTPPVVTVSESQAAAAAVVTRSGGTLERKSVIWWTSDGTAVAGDDYADLDRQVATFAAGEDTLRILVPIIADFVIEDRESFHVNLIVSDSAAASAAPEQRLEVVIVDDDR